jgi:hypothetical protein
MKRTFTPLFLAAVVAAAIPLTFVGSPQTSAAQVTPQASTQVPLVYGRALATPEERAAFHAKLLGAKTSAELDAIRLEHHKLVQQRAQALGLRVPELPRAAGLGPYPGGMRPACLRGGMGTGHGYGMWR